MYVTDGRLNDNSYLEPYQELEIFDGVLLHKIQTSADYQRTPSGTLTTNMRCFSKSARLPRVEASKGVLEITKGGVLTLLVSRCHQLGCWLKETSNC